MRKTRIPTPRYFLRCHEVHFYVQKDFKAANVQLEYEVEDTQQNHRHEGEPVKIPVFSLWADQSNNVIKAHLMVRRQDRLQDAFFRIVRLGGESTCPLSKTLVADSQGFIRYGCRSKTIDNIGANRENDYQNRFIYNTKAEAMKAILTDISHHRTLGGLNLAHLGSVSDTILEQFGYQKVPDVMKRGTPMWMGNPELITNAGSNAGYYTDYKKQELNIGQFLELLQKELGAEPVSTVSTGK